MRHTVLYSVLRTTYFVRSVRTFVMIDSTWVFSPHGLTGSYRDIRGLGANSKYDESEIYIEQRNMWRVEGKLSGDRAGWP